MESLKRPTILESYEDHDCRPPLTALRLRWDTESSGMAERSWYFPEHLTWKGPAPERFGMSVVRLAADSYDVRLLWNEMRLSWRGLSRVQILTSALSPLLQALGQDLWQILNQPIDSESAYPVRAA